MAQVPYSPVPDVVPAAPAAPKIGIDAQPAAFGAATAGAVRQLGQQTEQSSNEMFQTYQYVQGIRNETWAKDAFVKAIADPNGLGDLDEGFRKLRGADAQAAYPKFKNDVTQLYQNAIANAPNPQAARFLGDVLSRRVTYSIEDAGRHAGQQQFVAADKASDDNSAGALSSIQQNATNPDIVRQSLDILRSEAETKTRLNAGSASDFNQRAEKMVSEGLTIQLKAIGFDDPQQALAMLAANQKLPDDSRYKMKGIAPNGQPYVESIKEYLQRRNNMVGADADANTILFGSSDADVYNDKTLTPAQRVGAEPLPAGYKGKGGGEVLGPDSGPDFLEKAVKRAYETGKPYGAEYTQHLVAQVENKYRQFNTAYRMEEYGTFAGLSSAITGANGQAPITDRDTLLSNPVLYQQFESLAQSSKGKVMQEKLLNMIDHNSQRGSLPEPDQRALIDRIKGFAIDAKTDPAARDEFINMNWSDLYSKVDPGLKGTLSAQQNEVRQAWAKMGVTPGQDRVTEAVASLKPAMDSAGIKRDPNNKAANSQYYEFIGALSAKIQAQEAVTGKRLSDKEINDIAVPLIQRIGGIGQAIKNNGGVGAPKATPANVPQASM